MFLLHRLHARNFKQLQDAQINFPAAGSILIEGSNEAGKSSLFEAIFFALYGQTLIADRDYRLEHLRRYGQEEMTVELEFSVSGRPFSLQRKIVRGHTARLTCPGPEGQEETIRSVSEIERRLRSEIRLSPAALLNTCFVEQKRLERLEELRPEPRRETVNELLNLRLLTALEDEFKITREDSARLQDLQRRIQVAQLDAALPALDRAALAAEIALTRSRRLALAQSIETTESELASDRRDLDEVERALFNAGLQKEVQEDLVPAVQAWESALSNFERASRRREEIRAAASRLPLLEDRLRKLEAAELTLQTAASHVPDPAVSQRHLPAAALLVLTIGVMLIGASLLAGGPGEMTLLITGALVALAGGAGIYRANLSGRTARIEGPAPGGMEWLEELGVRPTPESLRESLARCGVSRIEDLPPPPPQEGRSQEGRPTELEGLRWHIGGFRIACTLDRRTAADLTDAERESSEANEAVRQARRRLGERWERTLGSAPLPEEPEETLQIIRDQENPVSALTGRAAAIVEDLRARRESLKTAAALAERDLAGARQAHETLAKREEELMASIADGASLMESVRATMAEAPQRDSAGWEDQAASCQRAIYEARHERRVRAEQFAIGNDPLDLDTELAALALAEKAIAVKRRAGEMVSRTRQSIVSRVMPLTMRNMQQLLPLLTEGRYQDAQWDEETNTISVYDSTARAYQRKRVFSGGARDQISLTLRLAFALATLPGEHNIRPGFLFLDEPLSSFDRDRTRALVDLLTRGLLRQQFAQILLVSHSESFDPDQFDYRIRMQGGRVVESTLPVRR